MPELGRERPEFGKGTRCLNHDKYLILYIIEPEVIYVRRVLDGRMDLEGVFEQD